MLVARVGVAIEMARLREVEARERARTEFLNEVGAVLAESLEYESVLQRIAHLAVPRLADGCVLYTLEGDQLKAATRAHAHAEDEALLQAVHEHPQFGPASPRSLLGQAFHTGKVLCATDYSPRLIEATFDDPVLQTQVRALEPRSVLALPFAVDDRVIGVIGLYYCKSGRRYEEADVLLARALCHRATLAIENARLYDQVKRAVRARDDMLAVVAHDLRNPLAAIHMISQVLELQIADPVLRRQIQNMRAASRGMDRLVRDLLDAAALDAGVMTLEQRPHSLSPLIGQALNALETLAAEKGVRLETAIPHAAPEVRCDAERIVQVLGNLVGNGIRFTPSGGTVRVEVKPADGVVRVVVSDTGPGIARELREHLFERYWKGQKLGTGLGLYIARRIVDAHGGELALESSPGEGAVFAFTLPTAKGQSSPRV
jgi:signal transduction histidine kinase